MPSLTAKQAELERVVPLAERHSIGYTMAGVLTGLTQTKLQELVASGTVRSAKIGRTRLIDAQSLLAVIVAAQKEPIKLVDGKIVAKKQKAKKRGGGR